MRTAMVVAALLAAATALANPIAEELYIDFNPPYRVDRIDPAPYTQVWAGVVIQYLPPNIKSIAFDIEVTPGVSPIADFEPAEPGYIVQGAVGEGIVVTAEDCFTSMPVVLGGVSLFILGNPGWIEIAEHPDLGHVFTTCDDPAEERVYCVTVGGGIYTYPPDYRVYCWTPVEDVTWGAIKGLYR